MITGRLKCSSTRKRSCSEARSSPHSHGNSNFLPLAIASWRDADTLGIWKMNEVGIQYAFQTGNQTLVNHLVQESKIVPCNAPVPNGYNTLMKSSPSSSNRPYPGKQPLALPSRTQPGGEEYYCSLHGRLDRRYKMAPSAVAPSSPSNWPETVNEVYLPKKSSE